METNAGTKKVLRLTSEQKRSIKQDLRQGTKRGTIAEKYGISKATVQYYAQRTRRNKRSFSVITSEKGSNPYVATDSRKEAIELALAIVKNTCTVERVTKGMWIVQQ